MRGDEIYINNLDNYLKPLQTPFEIEGRAEPGNFFFYVSNASTGRWSYLYRAENQAALMNEWEIPSGRMGLTIAEKIYSVKPDNKIISEMRLDGECRINRNYPKDENDRPFVVFKAPRIDLEFKDYHDTVSYETDENAAIATANFLCNLYKIPHLVGLRKYSRSLW